MLRSRDLNSPICLQKVSPIYLIYFVYFIYCVFFCFYVSNYNGNFLYADDQITSSTIKNKTQTLSDKKKPSKQQKINSNSNSQQTAKTITYKSPRLTANNLQALIPCEVQSPCNVVKTLAEGIFGLSNLTDKKVEYEKALINFIEKDVYNSFDFDTLFDLLIINANRKRANLNTGNSPKKDGASSSNSTDYNNSLTIEQKNDIKKYFSKMLINGYLTMLTKFSNTKFQIIDEVVNKGDTIEVANIKCITSIGDDSSKTNNLQNIDIIFSLKRHLKKDATSDNDKSINADKSTAKDLKVLKVPNSNPWLIYDVKIQGVSTSKGYEEQLGAILSELGPDGLIKELKSKIANFNKANK